LRVTRGQRAGCLPGRGGIWPEKRSSASCVLPSTLPAGCMAAARRASHLKVSSAPMLPEALPDSAKKWLSATPSRMWRASTRRRMRQRRAQPPPKRRAMGQCRSPARAVARAVAPGMPARRYQLPKRCNGWPSCGLTSTRSPARSPRYSRRRQAVPNLRSRPRSAGQMIRPGVSLKLFSAAAHGPRPMPPRPRRLFGPGRTGRRRPFNAESIRRRRSCLRLLRLRRRRRSARPPHRAHARSAVLPEWRKWFQPTSRHPRMTLATICPNPAGRPSSARFRLSRAT